MVKSMAKGLNKSIFSQVCDSGDDALARKTWDSTVEEIDKQWVWRDVHSDHGDVVMAKRFGLQQKDKVRVIEHWRLQQSIWHQREVEGSRHRSVGGIFELVVHRAWPERL